jgi:epoxyqueuosine reductase
MNMPTTKETDAATIQERLLNHLTEHRYQGRIVSTTHLPELKENIEGRRKQGMFNKEFYQERLNWFDFQTQDSLPEAKSIIVVAVPSPQSQATFNWNGQKRALIIPPTYVPYEQTTKQTLNFLAKFLNPKGYHVARTALPLKLLAVQSGLAEYGRNNICYVPNMGSFLQLVAAYSDLPCTEHNWREPQMMQRCQNCQACRLACPTGAIATDRFLLHAERCIVFHNERKGNIPFPNWIDPSWHNCVQGCLHCQRTCPENRNFLQWIEEKQEFSQKETALLLNGASLTQLPATTVEKLEHLDLIGDLDRLPRNLSVFFNK